MKFLVYADSQASQQQQSDGWRDHGSANSWHKDGGVGEMRVVAVMAKCIISMFLFGCDLVKY